MHRQPQHLPAYGRKIGGSLTALPRVPSFPVRQGGKGERGLGGMLLCSPAPFLPSFLAPVLPFSLSPFLPCSFGNWSDRSQRPQQLFRALNGLWIRFVEPVKFGGPPDAKRMQEQHHFGEIRAANLGRVL